MWRLLCINLFAFSLSRYGEDVYTLRLLMVLGRRGESINGFGMAGFGVGVWGDNREFGLSEIVA